MNMLRRTVALFLGVASLPLLSGILSAAEAPAGRLTSPLPPWIVESSVSGRLGYDTNVFGTETERPGIPLAEREEWVTTLNARFLFSPAVLHGAPKERLVLGYAPTVTRYSGLASENHTLHRLLVQSAGKEGDLSWTFDSTTTRIVGRRDVPRYNTFSAYGISATRERRAQWQNNTKFALRLDNEAWFGRFAGSFLFFDLLTEHHNPAEAPYAGWLNYVDRYDYNAGLDAGWKASKTVSLVLGWRHGHQKQQAFDWSPGLRYQCNSRYDRVLIGIEGKPAPWLALNVTAGPDFREYLAPDATRGVVDPDPTCVYFEGTATATLSKTDSLVFAGKQWRWVSSTGRVAADDKSWSATWKHALAPKWSLQLAGQWLNSNYSTYPTAISSVPRNDSVYGASAQIGWTPHKQVAVTFDLTVQDAKNQTKNAAAIGREYTRTQFGVTAKFAF